MEHGTAPDTGPSPGPGQVTPQAISKKRKATKAATTAEEDTKKKRDKAPNKPSTCRPDWLSPFSFFLFTFFL